MEKIVSIEEVSGYGPLSRKGKRYYRDYCGYVVTTTKQRVELLIGEDRDCCEIFGFFWCNDKPEDFIGSEIHSIDVVDRALNKQILDGVLNDYCAGGDTEVMFVNFETDRGTLQFAAYNCHNGYYGHSALLISDKLEVEVTL